MKNRDTLLNSEFNQEVVQYENIEDLQFLRLEEGDHGYEEAELIYNFKGEKTDNELEQEAKNNFRANPWWLLDYWQNKGLPKEQISITLGSNRIEVYNYNERLSDDQLLAINSTVELLAKINNGEALQNNKYILIDNHEYLDEKSGNQRNGVTLKSQSAIQLYPNALKDIEHRVKGVSNFEGTLLHEYAHVLHSVDFTNRWLKETGWRMVDEDEIKMIGDHTHLFVNDQPEKLPTDYAKFNHKEDIAESFVMAVKNPQSLDPHRLEILQNEWLNQLTSETRQKASSELRIGNNILLPKTPGQPITYKVKIIQPFESMPKPSLAPMAPEELESLQKDIDYME